MLSVLLRVNGTFIYPMGDIILSRMYLPEKNNGRPQLQAKTSNVLATYYYSEYGPQSSSINSSTAY